MPNKKPAPTGAGQTLKGNLMKHLLLALSAVALLATAIPAKAGCNGTYHCTQGYNGKQVCGC